MRFALLVLVLSLSAGCNCTPPSGTDAGTDAGPGADSGLDAGLDAGFDAGADAGVDAGSDAGADAGLDGGTDAGGGGTWADGGWSMQVLAQYTDTQHALEYAGGLVWAVDSVNNQVRGFDPVTYQQVATVAVGPVPGRMVSDSNNLYVLNRLARDQGDTFLSVVSLQSRSVVHSSTVSEKRQGSDPNNYPWTNFPWDLTLFGSRLFVTFPTNAEPDVLPIDVGTWVEHTLWAAGSGPQSLRGLGTTLFVENGRGIYDPNDDAVLAYDTSGTLLWTFETHGRLQEELVAQGKVWIAKGTGEVLIFDSTSLTTHTWRSVPVSPGATGLAEAAGLVYVTSNTQQQVDIIDATSEQVVDHIFLAGQTPPIVNPRGIAVSPQGDVYLESDGMISVLRHP